MSSLLDEHPAAALSGVQEPRILAHPPFAPADTSGDELCDFAARHGLVMDPWQRFALRVAMGEKLDGRWGAFEVAVIVARQNGKGSILEARELGGLFLLGEQLMVHTAHLFKTSHEAFLRIARVVRDSPELMKRVHRIYSSPSNEGIELKNGNRLLFLARSGGSGRGFSGDWVCLDEAYDLPGDVMDALVPTMSARDNAQLWYTSSAGKESSLVLQGVRARALAGDVDSLAYMEWSAPDGSAPDDRHAWEQANPALGIRITEQAIIRERAALSEAGFLRERLTLWPEMAGGPFAAAWPMCLSPASEASGPATFAVEVADDRSWSAVCVAAGGHVEVVDYREGTEWVVEACRMLDRANNRPSFVVQTSSPAGPLIVDLEAAGLTVVKASDLDYAQACGGFFDAVVAGSVRHLGQRALDVSVLGARKKPRGDAFVWDRRKSLDISPLAAVTLAFWGSNRKKDRPGRFIAF